VVNTAPIPGSAMPTLGATYSVTNGSTLSFSQHDDVADATFSYANGHDYASAQLQWIPRVSAFTGSGTLAITCRNGTVDAQFMLQVAVINETTVRERFSNPQQVDCQTGAAKSYASEEVVWTVRATK
jgi:hypothetical protein